MEFSKKEPDFCSAHCGNRGHQGHEPSIDIIRKNYWWLEMKQYVRESVESHIHCSKARTGVISTKLLASSIHEQKLPMCFMQISCICEHLIELT